jgi:hypothetical protein
MSPTQGAELVALAEKCGAEQCGERGEFLGFPSVEALEAFAAALRSPGQLAGEPSDTERLDFITKHRIAIVPEQDGGWDAETYSKDDNPFPEWVCGGNTPRECIDAALSQARVSIDIREDA